MLRIYQPWDSQPQEAAELDRDGLGKGVQMLLMPLGGRLVDLVNPGQVWTPANQATVRPTAKGVAASFDGVGDYFSTSGYPQITGSVGTFFVWAPRIGAQDTSGHVWFGTNPTNSTYFQIGTAAANSATVFSQSVVSVGTASIFGSTNTSLVFACDGTATGKAFFLSGVGVGTANASAPVAFAAGSKNFQYGAWIGGANWDVDADCVIAGFTTEVWGEQQAKQFHDDQWSIFAPRSIWVPVSTGGGDPTVAITGAAATGATGTPVPSLSLATTGNAATTSAGTAAPNLSVAIAGNAATANTGTTVAGLSLAITGNAVTASAGVVSAGSAANAALAGNEATTAGGTATAALSLALSGVAATTAAGTVSPSLSKAITGNAATSAAGTPVAGLTLALSGNAATSAAGTVAVPGIVVPTGVQATTASGTVSPAITVALTGNVATTSVGAVSPAIALALSGLAGTSTAGIMVPGLSKVLSGNATTTSAGTISVATGDIAVAITGNVATASAGSLSIGAEAANSAWWNYDMPVNDLRFDMPVNDLRFSLDATNLGSTS